MRVFDVIGGRLKASIGIEKAGKAGAC